MFQKIQGFIPDSDDTSPGVLTDVTNMVPTLRGYAGAPSPINVSLPALAAECRNAAAVQILDGSTILFAGTQTKLYKAGSSTWEDVTDAVDYTGSASSRWCFAQQGNVTLAVNKVDPSQYYLHGTSTDFDALTGMPKASLVEAVGNFILIGDYNDGTDYVDGWGCSAIGDYTDWTADIDTQCTYGRLYDTPGQLTALKRLADYAIYYKRKSMYLARYVGTPSVWEFSLVSDIIGAVSNESVVRVGTTHYFVSEDNFYAYDTASVNPIGEQIKEWFNTDCNNSKRSLIQGLHNQQAGVVYWFYPQGTSTTLNAWVAYNYRSQKWGKGSLNIEAAVQYVYGGLTYDELDAIYTTYNSFPSVSYDDLNPTGSSLLPAIFNTSHRIQTLTGASVSSSLTSNDFGEDSVITLLSRVRARYLTSPSSATMTNYYRNSPGDNLTTDNTSTESSGKFDVLRSARWHRVKLDFTGSVEITGADISIQKDGDE